MSLKCNTSTTQPTPSLLRVSEGLLVCFVFPRLSHVFQSVFVCVRFEVSVWSATVKFVTGVQPSIVGLQMFL
jgi:hypothetical protein